MLGKRLGEFRSANAVVLALPRGGVPVAFEVARALNAPLDVIEIGKLGMPFQPELAMGAVGEGGIATGATVQAASDVALALGAKEVVVAVPVGSKDAVDPDQFEAPPQLLSCSATCQSWITLGS